jgi:hypothetical protein
MKPRNFNNNFLKQTEHAWELNDYCYAVCSLLASPADWQGSRVMWVGDYTSLTEQNNNLYEHADTHYLDLSETPDIQQLAEMLDEMNEDLYSDKLKTFYSDCVFVDLDSEQYLDLGAYFERERQMRIDDGETEPMVEHPVPLMLAAEGEGGGGDYPYRDDFGYGIFSGHQVGIYKKDDLDLSNWTEITKQVSFNENRITPAVYSELCIMKRMANTNCPRWF